jgi:hypothetical protein
MLLMMPKLVLTSELKMRQSLLKVLVLLAENTSAFF